MAATATRIIMDDWPILFHRAVSPNDDAQIVMLKDFPTAYPANWRLTRSGIKERT